MSKIEMDFIRSIEQAESLENTAEKLKIIADKKIENLLGNISSDWKSDSSTVFCRKGNAVKSELLSTANDIIVVARNIRKVAKATYDAEKRAEELARARTYMK